MGNMYIQDAGMRARARETEKERARVGRGEKAVARSGALEAAAAAAVCARASIEPDAVARSPAHHCHSPLPRPPLGPARYQWLPVHARPPGVSPQCARPPPPPGPVRVLPASENYRSELLHSLTIYSCSDRTLCAPRAAAHFVRRRHGLEDLKK